MVRSGPCRPRRSRTRSWNGHGELLVGEDALLAKLAELFDVLVRFPARGPLSRCCRGLLQHLLVQFLIVMLVARGPTLSRTSTSRLPNGLADWTCCSESTYMLPLGRSPGSRSGRSLTLSLV